MSTATFALTAFSIALATTSLAEGQGPERRAAQIVDPKPGAKVGHIEFVEGRIKPPGHPVVLVMPLAGDQPWYVQDEVEGVDAEGRFTARVHIGEEKPTKPIKFRIVILVIRDEPELRKKYAPGSEIKNLPAGVPRSEMVTVLREAD